VADAWCDNGAQRFFSFAMSRFLFAWELGGGLGHLGHFVPVARALRERGHQAALALKDLRTLSSIDPGHDIPVFQAPICTHTYENLVDPPLNYAEVLMRFGFVDSGMLTGLVRGWRSLAHAIGTDVMVADHAPSAILAAKTLGMRCVVLGNAFTIPPAVAPTPNMRPWLDVPPGRLESSDKSVLNTINEVLTHFATPAMTHLYEMFAVDDLLVANFSELDHYRNRPPSQLERIVFCGPITSAAGAVIAPQWPAVMGLAAGTEKRIFAYLKPGYPHLAATLKALAATGQPCVIYGLGAGSPAAPAMAANLFFSSQPIDLAKAGRECALGICHSGGTTAPALLHAGRPLLLLPTQLEQFLEGTRIAELGAGQVINPEEKQPDIAGALARLLNEPRFAQCAGEFAARYHDWSPDRIVGNIATRLADAAPLQQRGTPLKTTGLAP
jgi:UDP:flavonoid glycosyltransferase YjiC (YdhE family)